MCKHKNAEVSLQLGAEFSFLQNLPLYELRGHGLRVGSAPQVMGHSTRWVERRAGCTFSWETFSSKIVTNFEVVLTYLIVICWFMFYTWLLLLKLEFYLNF